ncbi:hypothetical protein [Acrocarpospora catenulata]|uniref:hypothetical protein n=1 Tax=Acrocarpospora catenulata TaxID=2836182 RepID=UPI001BD94631|nr:hypothetical protein [Acrocarpospora catenulata]
MTTISGRGRIAVRAAVAGLAALCGLIALPALAAEKTTRVQYACPADGPTYPVSVILEGPDTPTPNGPVAVTWRLVPASPATDEPVTESLLTVPASIAVSDLVIAEGQATISGTPIGTNPVAHAPAGTITAGTAVPTEAIMSPIPDMVFTFTPTAVGTVNVVAGNFMLKFSPTAGGDVSTLYTCNPVNVASAATLALVVSSETASPSETDETTTATTTATSTVTATETVAETETVTATATISETSTTTTTQTSQVKLTPVGGAQTGGGGDIGPDGRTIMLVGILLIATATCGGLLLRDRVNRDW